MSARVWNERQQAAFEDRYVAHSQAVVHCHVDWACQRWFAGSAGRAASGLTTRPTAETN